MSANMYVCTVELYVCTCSFRHPELTLECSAVDGLAAGAVARGEVARLDHEVLDHPVEDDPLVVELLAGDQAKSLFARAQGPEVLGRLRRHIAEELENNAAHAQAAQRNVEKASRSRGTRVALVHRHCFRRFFPLNAI